MSDGIPTSHRAPGRLPTPGEIVGEGERPDGRGERLPTPGEIVAEDRGRDGPGLADGRGRGLSREGLQRELGRGR